MSQARPDYDLIIVGASFSGLVAARTAAMRGLKVAVLEAKPDAGARVHTTGILVKEAAEEIDVPHRLTRKVHGVRLYAPNHTFTDLFAPGYFFLTTDTPELLRWLASEAQRAGAKIFYNARFRGAERDTNAMSIGSPQISGSYLLGADGGRSRVAQAFGLGRNTKFLVGLENEYDGLDNVDPRFLHCFADSQLAPGYLGWVAPGPRVTQVGLAVHYKAKADLDAFTAATDHIFDYGSGEIREKRSGRIPCGGVVSPFAAPNVLLIGDAAGLVSPMTGGGIRLAFHFAKRAAHLVADHIHHMGPAPEAVLSREIPRFAIKGLLRKALDLAPPNALINACLGTPPARAIAQRLYFHKRRAPGVSFADFENSLDALQPGTIVRAGGQKPIAEI
ncbi:MAG: NAD(P)/FAD-dependent oxidoreductase [Hyphomicrobiaceae bacterium]